MRMTSESYSRLSKTLAERFSVKAVRAVDKVLVAAVAAMYLICGVWLAVNADGRIIPYVAVPLFSLIVASVLRALVDRPRPYEVYSFEPALKAHRSARSFPSRHVFSAAVIACALFSVSVALGVACIVVTALIATIRVAGGLHWPTDVIGGAVLGLAFWALGAVAL